MRTLSDQQKLFLQVLFEEANGSITEAKKLAGYAATTSTTSIVKSLKDEIADNGSEFAFYGIERNVDEIKSFEGCDILWIEEAHNLTKEQ